MNQEQQRELFLASAKQQLIELYTAQKERGKQGPSLKHHAEGFMHAGIVLELATNEELTELIGNIYYDTFGMTPVERKLQQEKGEVEEKDWSYYDLPLSQR